MEYPIEIKLGTYTLRVYEDLTATKKQITNKYGERWIPIKFTKEKNYYRFTLTIDGKRFHFRRHRLIYYAHNKDWDIFDTTMNNHIDHINGTKEGDYIHNLRNVTNHQNTYNRQHTKGYYWCKNHTKWIAHIGVDRKQIVIYCDTEEEAIEARKQLKIKYHKI